MWRRNILIVVAAAILAVQQCVAQGPYRYCAYNTDPDNDYTHFYDTHIIGTQISYTSESVTEVITDFALETAVHSERVTDSDMCNFDYTKSYNGWIVTWLDQNHCGMQISKNFSSSEYFQHCAIGISSNSFECPGCYQYRTTIVRTSAPMYTGTLPDGTKTNVTTVATSVDHLIVPTSASTEVEVNVVAPVEYGVTITGTLAVIPGTTTLGMTFWGQINWPYGIGRMITPPTQKPADIKAATVVPLLVEAEKGTWGKFTGLVVSIPQEDCKTSGSTVISFEVICLDDTVCDAGLFEQNKIITGTLKASLDGCPENYQEGTVTASLEIIDPETREPVSSFLAGKAIQFETTLTPNGCPDPYSAITCKYDVTPLDYSGNELATYADVGSNSAWNPSSITVENPKLQNTLQVSVPVDVVSSFGNVLVVSVVCDLPQPPSVVRAATPTSAESVNAFSIISGPSDDSNGSDDSEPNGDLSSGSMLEYSAWVLLLLSLLLVQL